MCGGAGGYGSESSGPKGYNYSPNYVKNLTKAIESNLANNNAGVRSGDRALYGGGGDNRDRQGGGSGSPGASGGDRDRQGGGSGMGRGGEDVGRPIGGGGIGSVPTPNVSGGGAGYDYVSTPAPAPTPQQIVNTYLNSDKIFGGPAKGAYKDEVTGYRTQLMGGNPEMVSPARFLSDPTISAGLSFPDLYKLPQLTPQGRAALLGNFSFESGAPVGKLDPTGIGPGGDTGVAQWMGDRKERLLDYFNISRNASDAEIKEKLAGTTNEQIAFALNEIETDPSYKKTRSALTDPNVNLANATDVVLRNFERPKDPDASYQQRLDRASDFYQGAQGEQTTSPLRKRDPSLIDNLVDSGKKLFTGDPTDNRTIGDKALDLGIDAAVSFIPGVGLVNLASGLLGYGTASSYLRKGLTSANSDAQKEFNRDKQMTSDEVNLASRSTYGPYGNLTREQYRDQYGGRDQVQEAPKSIISAITPAAVAATTPVTTPAITPQGKTAPVAPGTTPNTRKLSDEEYAALSPLEKAYYDMGISTYGTFTPEYNYFPNRQPIYLREPDKENKKRNGGLVKGPGTETSDSVPALIGGKTPAALSDGEFVFTGRAVRGMGNGDRMEGARKLHQMMKKAEGNASKGGPRK